MWKKSNSFSNRMLINQGVRDGMFFAKIIELIGF